MSQIQGVKNTPAKASPIGLILVMIFAGAMVALGGNELIKRYGDQRPGRDAQRMIQDLHGDMDPQRASLAWRKAPDSSGDTESPLLQKFLNEVFQMEDPER